MGCWAQWKDPKTEGMSIDIHRGKNTHDIKAGNPVPAPARVANLLKLSTIDSELYSDFSNSEWGSDHTDYGSINITLKRKGAVK